MRKKPQQQRSRAMVDALVEATAKTIIERGIEGVTTHHVAEQAGVSVGSLYQYFDCKESLVAALVDKKANEIAQALVRLPMTKEGDLRTNVRLIIQFGFGLLNTKDGLYLELVRNWQSLPTDRVMDVLQRSFMDISRIYFLKHYQESPFKDLHVRIFIISNSVIFTMMRFVAGPQIMMSQEEVIEGLTEMVVGYLGGSS